MPPPSVDPFGSDRNRASPPAESDATRIVQRRDVSEQETVILNAPGRPGAAPQRPADADAGGTLIGSANIQAGARVAGRPAPAAS